jgi:hypothetical protein
MLVSRNQDLTIRSERQASDSELLAVKHAAALLVPNVPEADPTVAKRRGRDAPAIGREYHVQDNIIVPDEHGCLSLIFHVPEPHGLILAARREGPTIHRKRERSDGSAMTFQC